MIHQVLTLATTLYSLPSCPQSVHPLRENDELLNVLAMQWPQITEHRGLWGGWRLIGIEPLIMAAWPLITERN